MILFTFIFLVIGLHIIFALKKPGHVGSLAQIKEEEMNASLARKKDINPEYFVTVDTSHLPIKEYGPSHQNEKVALLQSKVCTNAQKTMIRLPKPMRNVDIKLAFGVANLEVVIQYEENYNRYILSLINWAEELKNTGLPDEAETVLKESVSLGSDVSKSYTLLADIYSESKQHQKLKELADHMENPETLTQNQEFKQKMLRYIKEQL